jgi:putative hemolysin
LLVMFPAGEVAHLNWGEQPVADPPWSTAPVRLARRLNCATVPVFFDGINSIPFQVLGTLHPALRTINLLRELAKKRNQTIRLRIGTPISPAVLKELPNAVSATDYLRARTYLLRNRSTPRREPRSSGIAYDKVRAVRSQQLTEEIAALRPHQVLATNQEFAVYCARAREIPNVVQEIGRCREQAFRQVGEGTGNKLDLDSFDDYYEHLFLWSRRDECIAGGYRIAATPDVIGKYGINGLYTATLFRYDPAFFQHIGPALELGRSFVCREYQKHYAPLLLLWKGIARYAQQRPECPVLFGAVSISADYHAISRELIVNFLSGHIAADLKRWVKPRHGFRTHAFVPKYVKRLSSLLSSVEELSASVSDLEQDGKGVPVLIRHYLKVGGQLLGFNVDQSFSNALDALIMADLRTASPAMLERCMGCSGAASFRAYHALNAQDLR